MTAGTAMGAEIFKRKNNQPKVEKQIEQVVEKVSPMVPADPVAALNGDWTIYNILGEKVTGEERPHIDIELKEKRFYGSNGCNVLNGDVAVTGNDQIKFYNTISTRMLCQDAPFEYLINNTIETIKYFSIQQYGHEYYLDLKNDKRQVVMVLRKHNMDFLNGAWAVASVDGEANRNENVRLVIDIPEAKLHGNTGCNILNGSLFIDPDKSNSIQFQDIATTRMMCPDMASETSLLVALEEVESAFAKGNDLVVMLDGHGQEVLQLKRLTAEELSAMEAE